MFTNQILKCLCFCLLLPSLGAWAAGDKPQETVQRLHDGLQNMDARLPPQDRAARRQAIRQLLATTHDLDYMARFTLGRHWQDLTEAQRERYLIAFTELSISSYADNFKNIQRDRFETMETRDLPRSRALVRTRLVPEADDPVDLDYTLQKTPGKGWRIIQVRAEGVSDLALKRSQFSSLLVQDGFDALIEYIYKLARVGGRVGQDALEPANQIDATTGE